MVALTANAVDENELQMESVLVSFQLSEDPPALGSSLSTRQATLRCEVVSDFCRLVEFSSEWARLWKSDSRAEIFQTPEWAISWWRSFGQGSTLCTLVVFADDEVIGIVPLLKRDGVIRFLGTPQADYADIICEEEWAAEVLAVASKTLCESVTGWSECVLEHLSKNSRVFRHYRALPRQLRGTLHCLPTERYQTIVFRDKRDAVFNSLLGKHHTRRRWNKLQKAGQVRFRHLETQRETEAYLNDFFRHHVRRHAVSGKRSAYTAPKACQFMRTLMAELGPAVRFGVLELDGRPLAWHFGFEANGKFLLYQHTFDLDAWDYSPGELLLWSLFEYARDHVAREFDFGKGDEPYKDRFANYSRETFSLYVEPPCMAGWIRGLGRTIQGYVQPAALQVKQMVKSHRAVLRAFRSVRMRSVGTTARLRQANESGVLLQYGLKLIRDLLSDSFWSKQSIAVFGSDNLRSLDAESAESFSDLDVTVAGFGDLVDLAWQHPEILLLSELPRCRERLKNGDRVYIVRRESRVVILCWVSKSNARANSCSAQSPDMEPVTVMMEMDEWWNAGDSDVAASYRLLLLILVRAAVSEKADILIYCGSDQLALGSELERLRFEPRYKIIRHKVLSRFCRESVILPPSDSTSVSQVAEAAALIASERY
jgi:CelD/BcsL family acetyltransferase involved in cellulose biosynthesis